MQQLSLKLFSFLAFELIILFQICLIFLQWIFILKKEYMYYILYMIGIGLYSVLKYEAPLEFEFFRIFHDDAEIYLDKVLPFVSYFFYYRFARYFINLKFYYPQLNVWVIRLEYFLLTYASLELILKISLFDLYLSEILYLIASFILFICSIVFIVLLLRKKIPLTYFIIIGAIFLNVGSFFTLIILNTSNELQGIFSDPFIILHMAIILEMLCFSTGLAFKTKGILKEKILVQKAYIEKLQQNLQLSDDILLMRQGIAREMHEELGEGISDVRIYASLSKADLHDDQIKAKELLNKLIIRTKDMQENLYDFIWTINPGNDSLEQFAFKIRQLNRECLAPLQINMKTFFPEGIKYIKTTPVFLRNALSISRSAIVLAQSNNVNEIAYTIDNEFKTFAIKIKWNDKTPNFDFNEIEIIKHNLGDVSFHENNLQILINIPVLDRSDL
jgi:signal transduction histidine kinase